MERSLLRAPQSQAAVRPQAANEQRGPLLFCREAQMQRRQHGSARAQKPAAARCFAGAPSNALLARRGRGGFGGLRVPAGRVNHLA